MTQGDSGDSTQGDSGDSDPDIGTMFSVMQNSNSLGGLLWLAAKDHVGGFKGKVVLFAFKTFLNYLETVFGLFILYLIYFRPYAIRPKVDTAALAAFDLGPGKAGLGLNNTLRYDLALNVTFWNDHRIWAIRYNHFSARLFFDDTQISPPDDTFPKFKSRTRRHRTLHPMLRGRASNVGAAMAEEFSRQRAQRWFELEVRLRAKVTYVIWPTWYHYYYEYDCRLHFPSNPAVTPVGIPERVKCSKGKRFGLV